MRLSRPTLKGKWVRRRSRLPPSAYSASGVTATRSASRVSVAGRKTVQVAVAAADRQALLAAAAARVRRVPRAVGVADSVVVADLHVALAVHVGGVVAARVVHAVGEGAAFGCRSRQDVVLVRLIANAFHDAALFGQRGVLI